MRPVVGGETRLRRLAARRHGEHTILLLEGSFSLLEVEIRAIAERLSIGLWGDADARGCRPGSTRSWAREEQRRVGQDTDRKEW